MKASRKAAGVGVCLSSCWIQRRVVKELVDPNFNLVDSKDAAVREESEELTLRVGEKNRVESGRNAARVKKVVVFVSWYKAETISNMFKLCSRRKQKKRLSEVEVLPWNGEGCAKARNTDYESGEKIGAQEFSLWSENTTCSVNKASRRSERKRKR